MSAAQAASSAASACRCARTCAAAIVVLGGAAGLLEQQPADAVLHDGGDQRVVEVVRDVLQRGAQLPGAAQPDLRRGQRLADGGAGGEAAGEGDLAVLTAGLAAQPGAGAAGGVQRVQLAQVEVTHTGQGGGLEPFGAGQHGAQSFERDRAGQLDDVLAEQHLDRC